MSRTDIPNHNFEVVKGDDATVQFRLLADGSPADLTGSSVYFECSDPTLNQLCSMEVPESGSFNVQFHKSKTEVSTMTNLRYKVLRYPSGLSGDRVTVFSGKLKLKGSEL